MATRRTPKPRMTLDEQAAELAKIEAELHALQEEQIELSKRRQLLQEHRTLVHTQLARDRLQDAVGGYVKLVGNGTYLVPTRRLQPQPGDIGRLLKINRTRALVDFGEELHTWYVALEGVGTVTDPLTQAADDLFVDRLWMEHRATLDEELDKLIAGPDELPDDEQDDVEAEAPDA